MPKTSAIPSIASTSAVAGVGRNPIPAITKDARNSGVLIVHKLNQGKFEQKEPLEADHGARESDHEIKRQRPRSDQSVHTDQ